MTKLRATVVLAALAIPACTLDAGRGFATIDHAEIAARFEPGDRATPGATLTTDRGYVVTIASATIELEQIEVEERSDDDNYVPLVTIRAGQSLDLLSAAPVTLETFEPSRELGHGVIDRVEAHLTALHLAGTVQAAGGPAVPLAIDVTFDVAITSPARRRLDRDSGAHIDLDVDVVATGTILDGLALDPAPGASAVMITTAPRALLDAIASLTLDTSLPFDTGLVDTGGDGHAH